MPPDRKPPDPMRRNERSRQAILTATAEYDIWNPDYAFAMAALGTQGG